MSERSLEVVLFADHLGTVMTGGAERVAAELLSHWPQQDRLHVVTATSDESFGSPRHEVTRLRQRRFGRLIGAEASIAPGALRAARRAVGASTDVVIVNGDPTDMDELADVVVRGSIGEIVPSMFRV